MRKHTLATFGLGAALLIGTCGCEELPGSDEAQGTVIGGAAGATTGAILAGEQNRVLGAILGGALGAAGGYVVGANADRITGKDKDAVEEATRDSQREPATVTEARQAATADIDQNGFVTLDEVVALENAEFSDDEILQRLRATGQIFDLSANQRQYLIDRGVSQQVISEMLKINQDQKEKLLSGTEDVIGTPQSL